MCLESQEHAFRPWLSFFIIFCPNKPLLNHFNTLYKVLEILKPMHSSEVMDDSNKLRATGTMERILY